tara:strand:- start:321 stop:467 length:147 start_codon:yes stop_codon:yes gene_type:complete
MDFRVELIADGFLFGITYFGKEDDMLVEEDWAELNIYLGIARLKWRWF